MPGKLAAFKARAAAHGQDLTLYPFLANPSGAGVNAQSGYPDPESSDYPATVPTVTYGPAVTVRAFVQYPWSIVRGGSEYRKEPQGEVLVVDLKILAPGDQAVSVHDKLVYGGTEYVINRITELSDGGETVYRTLWCREKLA